MIQTNQAIVLFFACFVVMGVGGYLMEAFTIGWKRMRDERPTRFWSGMGVAVGGFICWWIVFILWLQPSS